MSAKKHDGPDLEPQTSLDLTGLACPLPVLKTKKALAEMRPGELLHARTTDPMSTIDMTVFCERSGHEMVRAVEHRDDTPLHFEFYIRKDGAA